MKRSIVYRGIAREEMLAATRWYESEKQGLGTRFNNAALATIDEIAENPRRFPFLEDEIRQAVIDGFPYCVYYRSRADKVIVLAVYHQSRDPDGWRNP